MYPRERRKENDFIGRFRIHLKKSDGSPVMEQFPTRESVMLYLCEKIPQLKSRTNPPKGSFEDKTAFIPFYFTVRGKLGSVKSPVTPGVTGAVRRCAPAMFACNTGC